MSSKPLAAATTALNQSSAGVILAVNIGSSSLKFSTHPVIVNGTAKTVAASIFGGNIQGLEPGGKPFVLWSKDGAKHQDNLVVEPHEDSLEAALRHLKTILARELHGVTILAVAHRVVHGGEHFSQGILVTQEILDELHQLDPLAPLHQPHNLRGVQAFMQIFSGAPQVACFDTAFHSGISKVEKTFPLNQALYDQGVRRYGFHGLSYQYIL